jgi:YhcH/YjgK/YiaL family protein
VILDRLDRCDPYLRLGDRFAAGFDYLRSTDLAALSDGRYEIRGSDVVAIVQTYVTKPPKWGRWEAHRHHADIQLIVRGVERLGILPLGDRQPLPPYDAERDVEFYAGDASAGRHFTVAAGEFAVFLPHDLHMPSLMLHEPAEVKKVVVKVRLD